MSDTETARPASRLDARQREMLEAMGIQLWWPEPKARPAPEPQAPAAISAPAAREMAPPDPVARPAPAVAPPPAPRAAPPARVSPVLPGAETLLADAPRLLYGEAGPGGWLIVADMAPDMLGSYPQPLAGDEGRLLDNMLRALQLQSGGVPVHLVRLHRGSAAPGADMPRPYEEAFEPQCASLAPRVVLAMGPLAAQALLRRAGPIGKLRGEAQALDAPLTGAQAVATYHPAYLLRNGADKAKAWADLCLAAALFERA